MQNYFQKTEESVVRRRPSPLAVSQLDNMPSTSKAAMAAMASSSIFGSKFFQQAEDPLKLSSSLEEDTEAKPKGSGIKRVLSIKVDPDYNPRARLGTAPRGMLTRGQLKRNRAMLVEETSAEKAPTYQKPKPAVVVSLRRFRTSQRILPTVWHSGNVCQHALGQICNPETRQTAGNDVDRWRAIESICLDLRGINVGGNVGVLKGPVSFEDVFQVLGLDEQGEPKVKPASSLEVKVESVRRVITVASTSRRFDIENVVMPPLIPIQRCPVREPRRVVQERKRPLSETPRWEEKRTYRRI
ncbi:hypothetical protein KR038_006665 [Drosophila bunnanda]|nr:hypothetical protein KR038_006665 [Drosophila bunnanda]